MLFFFLLVSSCTHCTHVETYILEMKFGKTYINLNQSITLIQKLVVLATSMCVLKTVHRLLCPSIPSFPYYDLVGFYASSSFSFGANCWFEMVNYYTMPAPDMVTLSTLFLL